MPRPRILEVLATVGPLALAVAASGCFSSSNGPAPHPDGGALLDSGEPALEAGVPTYDSSADAPEDATIDADAIAQADAGGDGSPGSDASSDAAGSDAGGGDGAGGDGASPEAAAPGSYVDPVNGVDTNDGSFAHPFKTVKKASMTVAAGQTIYLFAGTYDSTNQTTMSITFPNNTWLRALSAGTVTFKFTGGGLTFNGGGVQDVAIQDFGTGGSIGMALNITGGTFSTTGVSFSNVGCPVSTTAGSNATVTIDMTGVATPVANVPNSINCGLVFIDGTSNVTWKGGGVINRTWAVSPNSPAIFARGASTVTIDGVTVQHYAQVAAAAYDNAHLTLKNVVIDDSGIGGGAFAIQVGGQNTQVPMTPSLTLDTTSVTASHGNAISLTLYGSTAETPSLTFINSHVNGTVGGDGVNISGAPTNAALTVTVTATNSTFTGNQGRGITAPRAAVSLTGGDVSNNTGRGVELTDAASVNSIKVRSTTFGANGGDFIAISGTAASSLDLGKAGDPGGIAFTAVPSNFSAVNLAAPVTGYAVGNTWIASQQGADGSGLYTSATTLAAGASGRNATVGSGASLVVE